MAFDLPPLPYPYDSLKPHISARTLKFHHDKHHQTYVDKLNDLIEGGPLASKPLDSIIKATADDSSKTDIFNNAAQAWNHAFYWHSMKPGGGGKPPGGLAEKIDSDLGGYDKFVEAFKRAAAKQFGSGWAWLVSEGGRLKVTKTPNADTPIVHGQTPLITIDVWEHAYYLDYQNKRPDYIAAYLDKLVNWDFAAKNLSS